ncbi:MAG: HAMP domain-containing protein [Chloroflexota bacterium]
MNFWPRSLQTRLVVLFLVLAIVPMAVVGYMAYDSGRRSIARDVKAHLQNVAILKEQEIDAWIEHLEHAITWSATNPQIMDSATALAAHPAGGPEHIAARSSLVSEFTRVAGLGHISPVFLLDANSGQIVASSDTSWEGQFRETMSWFTEGKSGVYVSDIFHSLALGRPTIVVAAPVTDSSGELLAVMAGHANLGSLNEVMLERGGLGDTGETYLVNEGNLLLTEAQFAPDAAFEKWIFTEGVERALQGGSGVALYRDYREEPVIGAYRWLDDLNAALLAEIDQSEAFVPIAALRMAVLRLGIVVALVVALVGIFFARTVTRPVHQLATGAAAIGRGNLDHRIEVVGRDEIGQLSRTFNEMAANLQTTTAFTDSILQNAPVGILVYRNDGQCVSVNDLAPHLIGTTREQALSQNFRKIESWRKSGLLACAERCLETGEPQHMGVSVTTTFGKDISIDVRFARFHLQEEPHLLLIVNDITSLKRTEESLRHNAAQLEAANNELESFAYSVSHDLRAPLRGMDGFTQALLEDYGDKLDSRGRDYALRVRAASEKMGHLIDDILQLSRAARHEMKRQTVDLSALARDAVAQLQKSGPERQVEVVIQDGVVGEGDAHLLSLVVANLLGNAWKFTQGQSEARIEFCAAPNADCGMPNGEVADDEMVYFVRDNGAGFEMEYVGKLFQPFQRLHSDAEFSGTGIGLATVRRIINRHGGRIWAKGAIGEGAVFYFTLGTGETQDSRKESTT